MGALDFLSPITGSKPQIADYEPIDLSAEQLKAITANIENFPQFTALGNLYQQYMLDQYERAIPGFRDILALGGQTTKDMLQLSAEELHGILPKDVQEQVERSSAYQSLLAGTSGSGMARALSARDLGLTSLNLTQQGAQMAGQAGNAAQRWASLAQAGGPSGMMVTTEQQAQLDMQQNLIKQATQQTKYNVAAAPDPGWKHISDIVYGLTAAYLGGGKGGGGGLPAGNAAASGAATAPGAGYGNFGGGTGYSKDTGNSFNAGYGSGSPPPSAGVAYNPYGAGFGYGTGYPAADPNAYYGMGQSPFIGTGGNQGVANQQSMYWTG